MYSGGSLKVRNVIISIGIKIPESLQVSQNPSQTSKLNSGGSLEVKNVIISIGTRDSWKSANVPESVADHKNGLWRVHRSKNCHHLYWHQTFLKVCECPTIRCRPMKWTLKGPFKSKIWLFPLAPTIPESLRVSKKQSQTTKMDSRGSLEVLIVNISIGTKIPESLRVSFKKSQDNEIVS
jgi:hypothetical protein